MSFISSLLCVISLKPCSSLCGWRGYLESALMAILVSACNLYIPCAFSESEYRRICTSCCLPDAFFPMPENATLFRQTYTSTKVWPCHHQSPQTLSIPSPWPPTHLHIAVLRLPAQTQMPTQQERRTGLHPTVGEAHPYCHPASDIRCRLFSVAAAVVAVVAVAAQTPLLAPAAVDTCLLPPP